MFSISSCEVCMLIDGDTRQKVCTYCPLCNAWLCESCRYNPRRRILAALKKQYAKWSAAN